MAAPPLTPETIAQVIAGTFPGDLGIEPLAVSEAGARGRLAVDERHLHPGRRVHGGVWMGLADTVAAWGTMANLAPGHEFTTTELKANVVASAGVGDELVAHAEPVHVGRRTQVWQVRVAVGERLGALFVCTQLVLAPRRGAA